MQCNQRSRGDFWLCWRVEGGQNVSYLCLHITTHYISPVTTHYISHITHEITRHHLPSDVFFPPHSYYVLIYPPHVIWH